MKLEEAKSKLSCKPKKLKEQLTQFGFENRNLKDEIKLVHAAIDKCNIGGGKVKRKKGEKSNKPKTKYQQHVSDCWDVHRSKKLGFKKTNEICRLEWNKKKGR